MILSRNPALTASQVVTAMVATARPVKGVAYGRVDPVAAFRWLGLPVGAPTTTVVAQPPTVAAPTPPVTRRATPAPGQLYTRQSLFETGTFKRGFRSTFPVGRGRFEMQLLTPLAASCSLSLSKGGEITVARPAVKNLLSLVVRVTAGRYTAEVQCSGARTRQYSLERHRDVPSRLPLEDLDLGCGLRSGASRARDAPVAVPVAVASRSR